MEEQGRSHAVVQAELMLLTFLIGFGALKWLSSGKAVNVEVNIEETIGGGRLYSVGRL